VLGHRFDVLIGFVVIINILVIFLQIEQESREAARDFGFETGASTGLGAIFEPSPASSDFLFVIDIGFNTFYLLELALRLFFLRAAFFRSKFNVFDGLVVLACVLSQVMKSKTQMGSVDRLIRMLRVLRIFKIFKVVRFMNLFAELRILIDSMYMSMSSLLWSLVLIGFIVIAAGILMVALMSSFLQDESADAALKMEVYELFGTSLRSTYTIFEVTFTASWVTMARMLIMEVNPLLAWVWIPFVLLINFAMMRVIGALFVKQTLVVANKDQEKLAKQEMKKKASFAVKLHAAFEVLDTSGDGVVTKPEFEDVLQRYGFKKVLAELELDEDDIRALFDIITDEDGEADYDEFLVGAMKLKSNARVFDTIQLMHEQLQIRRILENIDMQTTKLCKNQSGPAHGTKGGVRAKDTPTSCDRNDPEILETCTAPTSPSNESVRGIPAVALV
jgi:hypothetical protein